jgi:hypothetical protein
MEREKEVKVRAGNAFIIRGKCIAHGREEVQGVRWLADFFTHRNVLN